MFSSGRSKRPVSLGGEEVLGKHFKVLDNGFVCLVDYMGSDESIISLAKKLSGNDKDTDNFELIEETIQNHGLCFFESISVVFQIKLPIYIMGQLVRHRTAKLNSFSGRYSKFEDCFQIPDQLRYQSSHNKQVGEGEVNSNVESVMLEKMKNITKLSNDTYNDLIDLGLCKELARIVLTQNIYTVIYWKMDMKNLLHFLRLRIASDAQKEIRHYAVAMAEILSSTFPISWKVLSDMFVFCNAMSKKEIELMESV